MENRTIIGSPPKKFGYVALIVFGFIAVLAGSFVFFYEFSSVCEAKLISKHNPLRTDQVKMVLLENCDIAKNERIELQAVGSDNIIEGIIFDTSGEMIILSVDNEPSLFTNGDQKFRIYFNKGSLFRKVTNRNETISFQRK